MENFRKIYSNLDAPNIEMDGLRDLSTSAKRIYQNFIRYFGEKVHDIMLDFNPSTIFNIAKEKYTEIVTLGVIAKIRTKAKYQRITALNSVDFINLKMRVVKRRMDRIRNDPDSYKGRLMKYVHETMRDNEFGHHLTPDRRPITLLSMGILVKENWDYLSDEDIKELHDLSCESRMFQNVIYPVSLILPEPTGKKQKLSHISNEEKVLSRDERRDKNWKSNKKDGDRSMMLKHLLLIQDALILELIFKDREIYLGDYALFSDIFHHSID